MRRRTLLASAAALVACDVLGARDAKVSRASALLASMSLEQKAGQVMSVAFHGSERSSEIETAIRDLRVGSVIVFKENIASPAALASLLSDLQRIAREAGSPPLLFPIDQEGGQIVRLGAGATVLPGAMSLAATPDPVDAVRRSARITAVEMKALGLNFVLAPVADVNLDPKNPVIMSRSFGSDAASVSTLVATAIGEFTGNGLLCAAKHFPGHGDTSVDSHTALPLVTKSLDELERIELPPFRSAILARVPAVMTAHIRLPALDPTPDLPATLSRPIVTGILRSRLGFDRLVVTDDLEMTAITQSFTTPRAAVLALAAGADLLLFRFDASLQRAGRDAIVAAVRAGDLPQARLDDAARHVLEAKERGGVLNAPVIEIGRVGTESNGQTALDLARDSITVLRNRGILPVQGKRVLALSPDPVDLRNDEALVDGQRSFAAHLASLVGSTARRLELRPDANAIAAHLAAARAHDVAVVATYDVAKHSEQATLVRALSSVMPVAVVSLRSPYDAMAFPDVPAYVCAYTTRDVACRATAEVLAGGRPPRGALPVTVPGLFAIGAGLRSL
jgi:beta-N-acetylhexosaminidase